MKGRSNRLPTSLPPDDWVNGSWTVDCICGVNFDDGEEMVNCDECGVWVHTRCSRFVRGDKSFACDKCKSKTSRNDSEETEVAQLLIELPTKTIKMNNPYTLNNPPSQRPNRLWTDRPIEERVHVQGIPGGDPALFQGLPSIFSSELWKCTGYVPKKFNISYREFPCWDKQQVVDPKSEGDTENIVDKGAGVLYSLSKETAVDARAPALFSMSGQGKGGGFDKKASKERKWEGGDPKNSAVKNLAKKEKSMLRPIVLQCGKRNREDMGPSKEQSGMEKTSKSNKVHGLKTVVIHSTNARQLEVHGSKTPKVLTADVPHGNHGNGKDAGSQEVALTGDLVAGNNTENPLNNAATDDSNLAARSSELSGLGYSSEKRVKVEKLCYDAFHQVQISATTEAIPLAPLEKGLVLGDVSSSSDLSKPKPLVEDVSNAASEVKDTEILKNLETNSLLGSVHCNTKTKSDANVDNPKDLTEHVFSADDKSENSKVNEVVSTSSQSRDHEGRDGNKGFEAVTGCQLEKDDKITENPCNTKLECEGSESSMEIQKVSSDSKEVPVVAVEASRLSGAYPLPPPSQHKIVPVGKTSSSCSTIAISRYSPSDGNRSGSSQNPNCPGKRVISHSTMRTKRERAAVDPEDEDKHDKPKSTVKQHPQHNPVLKATQSSRTAGSPGFKHYTSVGRDSARVSSSKSSPVESSSVATGVGNPSGSLHTHPSHALHVQNKNIASGGQRREKVPQSNLKSSSKWTQSSSGHLPAVSNSPAGLSDEELALLLHQELNSSPRVPRVPRVRQAGSLPQLSSATATSMLIKRTSSSGGKDQHTFSRRKGKNVYKDGARSSRERDSEARKVDMVPSSPDSAKTSNVLTQAEANSETLQSARNIVEQISTSAANSGPSSSDTNELKILSTVDMPVNSPEDDTGTNKGSVPAHHTLPGLIAEIMSKGRRMTYEELCNAVLPHWQNLRKHNGERYAYSSHSQAVLDCLRNRTEWARLVDRGPKTNASRKKRKIDAEPPNTESEDGEDRTCKEGESKSFESNKEEFPKGRRKARKRRRLALQRRGVKDDRKRGRLEEAGSDDTGSFSNSSEDSLSSEDESQGSGMCAPKTEVSASSDEVAAV